MNIVVSRAQPADALEHLTNRGWNVRMRKKDSRCAPEELRALALDADALLLSGTDIADRSVIETAERLKVIACCSVGYDNVDVDFASKRGIVVCNAPATQLIDSTAEAAVALLLSVAKRVSRLHGQRGASLPPYSLAVQMGVPVRQRKCGIVGAGRIGSAIATIMHRGFANSIYYFSRSANADLEHATQATRCATPAALVSTCDFVFVAVPLTSATRHLLSRQVLQAVKQDAIVVNVSRAGTIDDAALVEMLDSGRLFGAGLDVYEAAARESTHPHLILTSHMANGENVALRATLELAVSNIVAVLCDDEPPTRVN